MVSVKKQEGLSFKPSPYGAFGDAPNTSSGQIKDGIFYPSRKSLADSFIDVQPFLPKYSPVNYNPVTASTATAKTVGGITDTLGDDYFDLIEQQATKKLNERYFGSPDSLAKQQQNMFNKRGLIGSGIEAGGANQLYKNFGDELVDLQSNISRTKAETGKELAFRNKEIELENAREANAVGLANQQQINLIAQENAKQQAETEIKNRDFQGFLSELGLRSAAADAGAATDFDTAMFGEQVTLAGQQQEFLNSIIGQLNAALANKNIDDVTRDKIEGIFYPLVSSISQGFNK